MLVERYRVPEPPVFFGPKLRAYASAALDVSDGLIADLGHMARASGVRMVVEASRIPRSPALRALWGDSEADIVRAATSGDDYQIAFAAPAALEEAIRAAAGEDATMVTRIGRVECGRGVVLLGGEGKEIPVLRAGFRHF